jgi:hypothetical protein
VGGEVGVAAGACQYEAPDEPLAVRVAAGVTGVTGIAGVPGVPGAYAGVAAAADDRGARCKVGCKGGTGRIAGPVCAGSEGNGEMA